MAKIQIKSFEILIANTHLTWREKDRSIRDGQIRELLKTTGEMKLPSLICGDLNDIPESSPLEQARSAGYENLLEKHRLGTVTWDNRNPFIQSHSVRFSDRQIDYILVHESAKQILRPKTCRRILDRPNEQFIYPSDHYGVVAEFRI